MQQSLTDLSIKKLPTKPKMYDVWDTKVPNFGLRVFSSGVKSFFISYRTDNKRRRDTIGRYPDITLAKARQRALEIKTRIALGENPAVPVKAPCFAEVLEDFLQLHCARHNKESTERTSRRLLQKECLPAWGTTPISDITRKNILSVLDAVVARGSSGAANRVYAAISKFFSWCVSRDLLELNPFLGIARPSKIHTRDRVLSDAELLLLWRATGNLGYPFGSIVRLLALTAQRRGELVQMEWSHIDFDVRQWHIPEHLTKNSKPHSVPLSPLALETLIGIPRLHETYVFPARGSNTTCFSGFAKCKLRLDNAMADLDTEQILAPWRLHDLRRTAATRMAQLQTPPHVIERVLNHTSGSFGGVAGIYNRYAYRDEMRTALDVLGAFMSSLVSDQTT